MLQGVLFNPGFGWFWKVFAAIGVRGTMTGSRGGLGVTSSKVIVDR
jgi:hypothetical protein